MFLAEWRGKRGHEETKAGVEWKGGEGIRYLNETMAGVAGMPARGEI